MRACTPLAEHWRPTLAAHRPVQPSRFPDLACAALYSLASCGCRLPYHPRKRAAGALTHARLRSQRSKRKAAPEEPGSAHVGAASRTAGVIGRSSDAGPAQQPAGAGPTQAQRYEPPQRLADIFAGLD